MKLLFKVDLPSLPSSLTPPLRKVFECRFTTTSPGNCHTLRHSFAWLTVALSFPPFLNPLSGLFVGFFWPPLCRSRQIFVEKLWIEAWKEGILACGIVFVEGEIKVSLAIQSVDYIGFI